MKKDINFFMKLPKNFDLRRYKERPILFSTPMVVAIQNDRKTHTRRTKELEYVNRDPDNYKYCGVDSEDANNHWFRYKNEIVDTNAFKLKCPYGQPGDILWVKETYHLIPRDADENYRFDIFYKADNYQDFEPGIDKWRSSIHMPRSAARIFLEIINIRVERVQDISRANCIAEGTHYPIDIDDEGGFINVWDSINAKRGYGWDKNPWVWVIEFKKIKETKTNEK